MNEKDDNEKDEMSEKLNELMKEVQTIKKGLEKERKMPFNVGRFIGETMKRSMDVLEEIPAQIERTLDSMRVRETFNSQFSKSQRDAWREKTEKRAEKIEKKAKEFGKRVERMAERLQRKILTNVKRELQHWGVPEEEIQKSMDEVEKDALHDAEEKAEEISKKIEDALEKGLVKTKEEFGDHINEALQTFDAGKTAAILNSLSSPERLNILRFLRENGRYYTDIGEEVGVGPSSLKFHLEKLKEKGLVAQERPRGKYLITEKGKAAIRLTAYLGKTLSSGDGHQEKETSDETKEDSEEEDHSERENS